MLLTLFGIMCQDRRFPLMDLFEVFSYNSLGCDIWLENVSVDADILMDVEHGDAAGDVGE